MTTVYPEVDADAVAIERVRAQVAAAFSGHGALAGAVAGFMPRASQSNMALAVLEAIITRDTLIIEAGTGTGKTFAYLVPALLAGGKVLVSTGTRTLQDQVFHKDVATLRHALGLSLKVALLKGRQNYVCLQRMASAEVGGQFTARIDATHLRSILRFAKTTDTGDRAELADVPESATIWPQVTSTRENCLGQECPRLSECFVYRARRRAMEADLVVVNHHLFLADLALRDDAIREFLPTANTVVLDEAHQLPKIATDFFGTGWSLAQLSDLAADTRSAGLRAAADGADWVALTRALEHASRDVRLALAEGGVEAGTRRALDKIAGHVVIADGLARVVKTLDAVAERIKANSERDAELGSILSRCQQMRAAVIEWSDVFAAGPMSEAESPQDSDAAERSSVVRWVVATAHGAQFQTTPLAIGSAFARARAAQAQAWILTSATLTVAGSFDAFVSATGLSDAKTELWGSPFDYPRQAMLYLPRSMPSPLALNFSEQVADAVWPVIEVSGGRAFVLCTTLRAVERVATRLRELMAHSRSELPLLIQGTSTRRVLLDTFRAMGNAVLVGSVSFWEGIDVRGEALSVVAIDKLPFAPPDDPVVEARIKRVRALGGNPFMEYQLPEAVTLLRQGAGRLIRDERDRGVLMILDERLLTKPYGRSVLASLPPFTRTRELDDVRRFFGADVVKVL